MPETAPLDVNESTVGYELDSITLRNICSVRYVRHHEWLDHLLESPVPTANIAPTPLGGSFDYELIETRIQQLKEEIESYNNKDFSGSKFYVNAKKTMPIVEATRELHHNFGKEYSNKVQKEIEENMGCKIVKATTMFPVPITYDRRQSELARAEQRRVDMLRAEEEEDEEEAEQDDENEEDDEEDDESDKMDLE